MLDAFSRRVVGWSIDSSQTANLVVNALGMAIENRQAEGVVIHSDHGTQGRFNRSATPPVSRRHRPVGRGILASANRLPA